MLTIKDIYAFINVFDNSSCEHLLLWLSKFNFYDQLCFVALISTHKMKPIPVQLLKQNYNSHESCICPKIYDTLPDSFKSKVPHINMLTKCVISKNILDNPQPINLNFHYDKTFNTDKITLKFIEKIKIPTYKFTNTSETAEYGTFVNQTKKIIQYNIIQNNNKTYDYSLPIQLILAYKIDIILPFLDILDVYTLYMIKYFLSLRDFERLLPEYWRSFNRKVYEKKIQNSVSLLSYIYNFYNMTSIIERNTATKATFKLPELQLMDKITNIEHYIIQPKLSGMRLVICKTIHSGILVTNKHNCKVKLNINLTKYLSSDINNSYTGEFILMLYDTKNALWLSSTHLINYLANSSNYAYCVIKLYILDLFLWNSVNLLILPFKQRCSIIQTFIETVEHNNIIMMLPEIENENTIYDLYTKYLKTDDISIKSPITGIVYRNKYMNIQSVIMYTEFNSIKCTILTKYNNYNIIVKKNSPSIQINPLEHACVIDTNENAKYNINFVCYNVNGSILNLAVFDNTQYIPFLNIQTNVDQKIPLQFMHKKINISNTSYSWVIVKIGFNKLFENVIYINIRPDKSLLDCISINTINEIWKNK